MKRFFALFCSVCLFWSMTGCANIGGVTDFVNTGEGNTFASGGSITVYGANEEVLATVTQVEFPDQELTDVRYRSYVNLALNEAVSVLSTYYNCEIDTATNKLFSGIYTLHTAFDPAMHSAIDTMYAGYADQAMPLGCAIIDYSGNICAVYSGGDAQYGIMGHSPFSTIKPLSVYAPAIENGVLDWSTTINDKPYKQLPNEAGKLQDWPVNPSLGYTYKDTLLVECIKQSLNTAAVHGLNTFGVQNSIDFLQNTLGMDLSYEQEKLTLKGKDEVIGNIAMGYLYTGVTPAELAGYYQIFGRGGQYTKPQALVCIQDEAGQTIYTRESQTKQVISEETAYIMNQLLSAVVQPGGTGDQAEAKDAPLVGKTGTGNQDGGNWFVGVTPQYACAIWHGVSQKTGNIADVLYTQVMENMPQHTVTKFPKCSSVRKGVFCSQTGKLLSPTCSQIHVGYYTQDRKPSVCTAH